MFCFKCGSQIADDALFCSMCGTRQEPLQAQPVPQPQPAPQPAAQAVPNKCYLYMDAKGLTLFNYKFDIRNGAGDVCFRAATVTESAFTYNARVYYPNDAEALVIHQQKKMTMGSMNFDIFAPNGTLVTEVLQKLHFATSEFQLPQFGLVVTGDFFAINFTFKRGEEVVATVRKKIMSWGDSYEIEFADPAMDQILIATIMVIQMVIAAARRRRR